MSRRRKIVSPSEEMIGLTIRLWHGLATAEIFTEYQRKFISIYNRTLSKIEVLPVPQRLKDKMPAAVKDFVQNRSCALARDFVADFQEKAYCNYLTFRDGWRYQVAIEAVREGQGWTELPL